MSYAPSEATTYLGDGLYASCDGVHIVLSFLSQGSPRIALEPAVFVELLRYARSMMGDDGYREVLRVAEEVSDD